MVNRYMMYLGIERIQLSLHLLRKILQAFEYVVLDLIADPIYDTIESYTCIP